MGSYIWWCNMNSAQRSPLSHVQTRHAVQLDHEAELDMYSEIIKPNSTGRTREDQIKPWVYDSVEPVSKSEPQLACTREDQVWVHWSGSIDLSHNWSVQDPDLNVKCQEGGTGPCTTVLWNTTVEAGVIIRHGRTGENTTQTQWRIQRGGGLRGSSPLPKFRTTYSYNIVFLIITRGLWVLPNG